MLLDARSTPTGTTLSATICVIGAGPAGITLAHELAAAGVDVLVLESGGWEDLPAADELNEAAACGPPYAGLRLTRRRGVGGTARSWNTLVAGTRGAKYVPLDASDLAPAYEPAAGWPIEWADLLPGYHRAQELCALGAFAYEAADWPQFAAAPLDLAGTALTSRVYQFGPAQPWLETLPRLLAENATVRVCTGATVSGWRVDSAARVCEAIATATGTGRRLRVQAAHYVLACGAVENARQLLALRRQEPQLAIDPGDWLGRCFMEHPRADGVLQRRGTGPAAELSFYDMHVLPHAVVGGRIALSGEHVATRGLPALSLTLLPRLPSPTAAGTLLRRLGLAKPRGGYGWSTMPTASRHPADFNLRLNFEQRPLRSNRLVLTEDLDPTGLPRARLEWAWSDPERRALAAARSLIVETLAKRRVGTVRFAERDLPDFDAHHHAGTTRMAQQPQAGVVDRDARVYGLDNLHVAGASVFPTAGYANPTLTIVALAVRLARRLAERIATMRPFNARS